MNVPLVVAGCLGLLAAGVHGIVGERVVVRRLSPARLPSSPFGGPTMTKSMIRATWHLTTAAFLTVGVALLLSGSVLDGEGARAVGAKEALTRRPPSVPRHPAVVVLPAIPVLAWWGVV